LRLGWMKGLHQEVEKFLKVAQQNADIHHMAYATYAAGLLLITQERRKEGLYRLQTAQALAASCGDDELLSQSLENQGFIYFLQEDWDRACFIQGKLIHFYNIRMLTDQKNVAQIRFHCAKEMVTTTTIATLELDNIEAHNEHVQYWWWIYHIVHYKSDAQEYWNKAKEVSVPKVWDLALYKMLDHLATLNYCSAIRVGILSELRDRFQQRFK